MAKETEAKVIDAGRYLGSFNEREKNIKDNIAKYFINYFILYLVHLLYKVRIIPD